MASAIYRPDITFSFNAAHIAEDDALHGHTYRVSCVAVAYAVREAREARQAMREQVDYLRPRFLERKALNETLGDEVVTVETVARWIFTKMSLGVRRLSHVRVEAAGQAATFSEKV